MSPISATTLTEALQWRYATKRFDSTRSLDGATVSALKETLRLAPSSFGLEPWKFIFVSTPEIKAKLLAPAFNQSQVTDCSHVVVLCVKNNLNAVDVDEKINALYAQGAPAGALSGLKDFMLSFVTGQPFGLAVKEWSSRQVYIAFGQLMTAAALLGIDTCPMEGINPIEVDKALDLDGTSYSTVALCCLGYRSADDRGAKSPKHRKATAVVIEDR